MKKFFKQFKFPIFIALIFVVLFLTAPQTASRASVKVGEYLKEMILIMPPVFILMGLIEVWVPKDRIQKWMGADSGIKGGFLAFLLGTLPTGPLYVAFPMAASLLRKGASVHNMVIFLGSWAALKIPQLMVETEFLGLNFALLRFALTLVILIAVGYIMQIILGKEEKHHWLPEPSQEGMMNMKMKMEMMKNRQK